MAPEGVAAPVGVPPSVSVQVPDPVTVGALANSTYTALLRPAHVPERAEGLLVHPWSEPYAVAAGDVQPSSVAGAQLQALQPRVSSTPPPL